MKIDGHSAGVVLIRKDGAILLQLRDDKPTIAYPNYWCLVGGHVEEGEDYKLAAIRELEEESGVKIPDAIPVWDEVYKMNDGRTINRHIYSAIYDGIQKIVCNEGQKIEFVSPADFSKMLMYPGHEKIITKAINEAKKDKLI